MKKSLLLIFAVAIVLGAFTLSFLRQHTQPAITNKSELPQQSETSSNAISTQAGGNGTDRDVAISNPAHGTPNADKSILRDAPKDPADTGVFVPIRGDVNAQARSVAEALKSGTHPERLTPLVQPAPFNADAYRRDSKPYLSNVEPGRAFQSASPNKDVAVIRAASPQTQDVDTGKSVTLRVKAAPKYPVSFLSMDSGAFAANKLSAITVEANEVGLAEVQFVATPGVYGMCRIQAASPMTSGQVKFFVNVNAVSDK